VTLHLVEEEAEEAQREQHGVQWEIHRDVRAQPEALCHAVAERHDRCKLRARVLRVGGEPVAEGNEHQQRMLRDVAVEERVRHGRLGARQRRGNVAARLIQ
jgi:hypothetical protein